MMRAFGRNETVARHGSSARRQERARSLVLVGPSEGVEVEEDTGATSRPVTTEGGIVRFGLSRDAPEGR
jgi:hypothetical protein